MNDMAKIVKTGAGQAVQLPEGFGFDADEVRVRRDGDCIVLEPADAVDAKTGRPLEQLRALIAEGEDESGDAELDIQEIIVEARREFEQRKV